MANLYGGIEAGGTKFKCVITTEDARILYKKIIPTSAPEATMRQVVDFFQTKKGEYTGMLTAMGIGSFGPLDLEPRSRNYGSITATPKPGWSQFPILRIVQKALKVPTAIDTDVNAAALGEKMWGAGRQVNDLLYLTIGTGIGGGAVVNGKALHGLIHPEMGHFHIPHDHQSDPFEGGCPFHGDCFEGLASGPALQKRWGMRGEDLPDIHPAWELEAGYIASALAAFICILSPQRIVLGGGVMRRSQLFPLVRHKVQLLLNGYIQSPAILDHPEEYICAPALGEGSGALGAAALAMQLINK